MKFRVSSLVGLVLRVELAAGVLPALEDVLRGRLGAEESRGGGGAGGVRAREERRERAAEREVWVLATRELYGEDARPGQRLSFSVYNKGPFFLQDIYPIRHGGHSLHTTDLARTRVGLSKSTLKDIVPRAVKSRPCAT